jgi:hypothetical protein
MPLNRKYAVLMSGTGSEMNKYSTEVEADSYYGYVDGLHTFQVTYEQFIGRVRIQATLIVEPGENDWFDIIPNSTTGKSFNTAGFVQFNADNPADKSEAYTIRGNFAWVRVYMDRTHIGDGVTYDPSYGQVTRVILST